MTTVTGIGIKNVAGEVAATGTVTISSEPRMSGAGAYIDGRSKKSSIVAGTMTSMTIEPGPVKISVSSGSSYDQFDAVVPDSGTVDIAALKEQSYTYTPQVVDAAVAAKEAAESARDEAQGLSAAQDEAVADLVVPGTATKTALDATYAPATGIAKVALASAVQTSLGKADTAAQPSDLTPKLDKTEAASTYATPAQVAASDALYKQLARTPEALIVGTITFDANGAATSASVVWPDGTPGTYTADAISPDFPSAVDAYHISYGSPVTKVYTQAAVTRGPSGAVTAAPAITVGNGADYTSGLKFRWIFDGLGLADGAPITSVSTTVDSATSAVLTPHATTSKQPTIHLAAQGGHDAAKFTRANAQYLRTALFSAPDIVGQPATIVAVMKRATTAAAGIPVTGGVSTTGQHMSISAESTTAQVGISAQGGGSAINSTVAPDTGWHIVGGVFDGASSRVRVDGTVGTGTVTNTADGVLPRITLGSNAAATANYLDGEILEVRVYTRALTTQDMDALRTFLKARYSITN